MAILCALLTQPTRADGKNQSRAKTSTLQEVVVAAGKPLSKRALRHAANTFTKSHAMLNPRSAQISHWVIPVCPVTRGLDPRYGEYVSHRILTIAHEVGAPSGTAKNCRANIWILFTRDPQPQVDRFASQWPALLGYTSGSLKELATVRFPIQAWYATGTAGVNDRNAQLDSTHSVVWQGNNKPPLFDVNVTIEGPYGSRLKDVESQIGFVLVVVNAEKVSDYSLDTVSDYLAMIVLTRTALNGCNALPSIIDLLSPDCGSREKPQALTVADKVFLRGLYGTHFGVKVNLEQGQINQQLVHALGR
jgi:hypothetical protein